jgi:DNA-binding MarR family transcriptional regulator
LQQLVLDSVSEITVPNGLTALEFTTLSVLSRHGASLTNSELARLSFMTAQAMHQVLDRLERAGLVVRNRHPFHRRKLPASLTPKGQRVVAACHAAIADFETQMLKGFRSEERARFLAMIRSAARNLSGQSRSNAVRL